MRVLLLAAVVLVVGATLPSPLVGSAVDRLVGTDCTAWCFNGTSMLQPEVWGATNTWCPDAHGCEWTWSVAVAPCSSALLSFDAHVGPARVQYATIDAATTAALQFYCSQSGSSAVLELRPIGGAAPIMTWRYQTTTCAALLGDLAAGSAPFAGAETSVALGAGGSLWFASGTERLEAAEVECAHARPANEAACLQCFRGADTLPVAAGGTWADVCGAAATECEAQWSFCWDVCSGRTSHASFELNGTPVAKLGVRGRLRAVCSASALRGRTIVALTDAADVAALDAGGASVYAVWEYRDVECDALMRAPRRSGLFVQRHVAVQRAATDSQPAAMAAVLNVASGGLDDRVWGGRPSLLNTVSTTAQSLSSTEVGLIVGLAVAGALCIAGWLLALVLWYRGSRPHEGLIGSIPLPLWSAGVKDTTATADDMAYLYSENKAASDALGS